VPEQRLNVAPIDAQRVHDRRSRVSQVVVGSRSSFAALSSRYGRCGIVGPLDGSPLWGCVKTSTRHASETTSAVCCYRLTAN